MSTETQRKALRGRVLTFNEDPRLIEAGASYDYWEDGCVVIDDDRIAIVGDAAAILPALNGKAELATFTNDLILPGFIDPHIHYPQTRVMASYGSQLMDWLERYTFVEEQKFSDPEHAHATAVFFLDQLLANGTTTASVFCTVHPTSVELFFAEASARNLRMIAGKSMMDRNAPTELMDTAEASYVECNELIGRWHDRSRLAYAITPRFAITSTEAQLDIAGRLAAEHPTVYVQTHLAENLEEVATVKSLFPEAASYTAVYDRFGLLGPRTLLGHCIHLDESEIKLLHDRAAIAVWCPTSNNFLGSGLFDLARLQEEPKPVRIALATDVGGGTSYSMLQTAAEAYKVAQLKGRSLTPFEAFYQMTLGNARALQLDHEIGTLAPGSMADLVVLDLDATANLTHRIDAAHGELEGILFALQILGDDRCTRATYVAGREAFTRAT